MGDTSLLIVVQDGRDDVIRVSRIGEAGTGEALRKPAEDVQEAGGGPGFRAARKSSDSREFQEKAGKFQRVTATPDLEGEDVVYASALADIADLLRDVCLDPSGRAELPKGVIG